MSISKPAEKTITNEQPELLLSTEPRGWLDQKLAWLSEFFSPILVKETRQSLKSRQFFWTFFLLLTATAIWSILGFSIGQSQMNSPGRFLLSGYWAILGFPLAIIIPFTVFRSLASEYENNTIQLVSITTMKPYQIVVGKVGSAMLQMLVFFSVLAPCISFTYLLRGVDLVHVGFGLGICFFGSLGLSLIGLFLAGITTSNVMRICLSVVFIFGLFMAYLGFINLMAMVGQGYGPTSEVLPSLLFGMSASFFAIGFLAFSAASAQISFPADNRSTLPRIAMLVFNVVLVSTFGLALMSFIDKTLVWICHMIVCHVWLIFGAMMCGENPFMSPRVRRSLPRSIPGKSFFSFLLPGPGRGYIFALINLWGWTAILLLFAWFGERFFALSTITGTIASTQAKSFLTMGMLANVGYSTLFLSATYMIIFLAQRKRVFLNPGGGFIIGLLICGFSMILSAIMHYSLVHPQSVGRYSDWQLLNWYWSSYMWLERGSLGANAFGSIVLGSIAFASCLACLIMASPELIRRHVAIPQRVVQDIEEHQASYVAPTETIENIFDERKTERESSD